MAFINITNNTEIDQAYVDTNGNPVTLQPGVTKRIEIESHPPELERLRVITDLDGAGNVEYIGYCLPKNQTHPGWACWAILKRIVLPGNVTVYRAAEADFSLRYVWTNRATYTY